MTLQYPKDNPTYESINHNKSIQGVLSKLTEFEKEHVKKLDMAMMEHAGASVTEVIRTVLEMSEKNFVHIPMVEEDRSIVVEVKVFKG